MKIDEFSWISQKVTIYGAWHIPVKPKAVVVLVHGFGEHSGRYLPGLIPFLMGNNLAVIRFDLFGHGKSGGKRGHCPNYGSLLQLVEEATATARSKFPGMPLVLYGHSLGGNLVLNQVLRSPSGISGVIASSPYLRLAFEPPAWKMALGCLLLHLWPSLTLDSGLDPHGLSRDGEEVALYKNDPLVHSSISPVYTFPVLDAGQWALDHSSGLSVPALLLHGTADAITDFQATLEFHEKSSGTSLKLFDGGYHELHHDLCREEFFAAIAKWLQGLRR